MTAKPKQPPRKRQPARSSAAAEVDFDAQLDDAQMPQREVEICLRGDLYVEVERLDAELRTMIAEQGDRLIGDPAAKLKAAEIEAVRAKMQASTVTIVMEGLPRPDFTRLQAQHPARPGNDEDVRSGGVNTDTMTEALIRASIVRPDMDDGRWRKLNSKITDGQYDKLGSTAWALSRGEVSIPFSHAVLKVQRSDFA